MGKKIDTITGIIVVLLLIITIYGFSQHYIEVKEQQDRLDNPPLHVRISNDDDEGQKLHVPGRHDGRAVLHREAEISHGHIVQRFAGLGGGNLPHGVDKIAADGGLKIVIALREVRDRSAGLLVHAHQRRTTDGHRRHLVVLNRFQQLGVFDSAVHRLAEPAVQNHRDQYECGDEHNIAHHAALRFLQALILLAPAGRARGACSLWTALCAYTAHRLSKPIIA